MIRIRQSAKMFLQNVLLPPLYAIFRHAPVQKGLVLFADGHHTSVPFSMQRMEQAVQKLQEAGDCRIEYFITDFNQMSPFRLAAWLFHFMRRYAAAEYVFICDYFLPVAACRKRPETKVVQLWHSCGLMKKIAYDTQEDIPEGYHGDMFGNYTYLTLSAKACIPVHEKALRLSKDHIFATGVSRTDFYFDEEWKENCRKQFSRKHPEAAGKKIAVWAPTFRGNAGAPRLVGLAEVQEAAKALQDDWYFVIKVHPHIDAHRQLSTSKIPTEELLPVADVLITDYSSILFDFLLFRKPAVLFAPDLEEYKKSRGLYIDYSELPFAYAASASALIEAVSAAESRAFQHRDEIRSFTDKYDGACDGHSTKRILQLIGLTQGTKEAGK